MWAGVPVASRGHRFSAPASLDGDPDPDRSAGSVRLERFGLYCRGGVLADRLLGHHALHPAALCQPACAGFAARPCYRDADAGRYHWNPARPDRIRHHRDAFWLACRLWHRRSCDDDAAGLPHSHR